MNYSKPKSFSFDGGGKRAVLLLHSFTGSTIDMRKLGKYLAKNGYTVTAPLYTGHGEEALELLKHGPDEWWNDTKTAYEQLISEGYEQVAVIGLSLGSVLALKVAEQFNPIGLVTMSLPMASEEVTLRKRVVYYARSRQQYEDKSVEQKEQEIIQIKEHSMEIIPEFLELIQTQMNGVSQIDMPVLALSGDEDEAIYQDSAEYLVSMVQTSDAEAKSYTKAGHLMTFGADASIIFEDISNFLGNLEWIE